MKKQKAPAPQRAGTGSEDTGSEALPEWVAEELRRDPQLLQEVAHLVRSMRAGSEKRRR